MSIDTEKLAQLQNWYHRPLGLALADKEQEQLDRVLSHMFGYHLVQLGVVNDHKLLEKSPINHHVRLAFEATKDNVRYSLAGNLYELPFQSDSVDVILLPHLLEFLSQPKLMLEEAARTLLPEGNMVILGFNPSSSWGLWHRLKLGKKKVPWCGNFMGIYRLRRLLNQINCDVTEFKTFFFRPPFPSQFILKHSNFLESLGQIGWPYLGGAYIMVAKKKVSTLTPIKSRWRFNDLLRTKSAVEPTTREMK